MAAPPLAYFLRTGSQPLLQALPVAKTIDDSDCQAASTVTSDRAISPFARGAAWLAGLAVAASLLLAQGQPRAQPAQDGTDFASPVSAQLIVPEQKSYVIGDPIPLLWEFTNHSDEPLAFLWEGCCRKNGRLEVRLDGKEIEPIPPAQALAHMFAKAATLKPGEPQRFESRLSDWVTLTNTGTYTLQGSYMGVLPSQEPQVDPGLSLWKGSAKTPELELTLLAPDDYLAQRHTRSDQRGLKLQLSKESILPPLGQATFRLVMENTSSEKLQLQWPHDFTIWILDQDRQRVGNVFTGIDQSYELLNLPPGSQSTKTFPLAAEQLHDQPFGSYELFVDLASQEEPAAPRAPSNPVPLPWQVGSDQLIDLLTQATQGPAAGRRNKPLQFLRLQLPALEEQLTSLPDLQDPQAGALAQSLLQAACLRPIQPEPGQVVWNLHLKLQADSDPAAAWQLDRRLTDCRLPNGSKPFLSRLNDLLNASQHLGWNVELALSADPTLSAGQLMSHSLPLLHSNALAAKPYAPVAPHEGRLNLRTELVPANLVLQVHSANGRVNLAGARQLPDPDNPQLHKRFNPQELPRVPLQPLSSAQLSAWLADQSFKPQTLIVAAANIAWGDLLEAVAPVLETSSAADLVVIAD